MGSFWDKMRESGFLQIGGKLLTKLGIFGGLLLWEKVRQKKGIPRHPIRFNRGECQSEILLF